MPSTSPSRAEASGAELDAELRRAIGQSWLARAAGELSTANLSSLVAHALFESGAELDVLALAGRAVSDEVRHARLCLSLAESYAGASLAMPSARHVELPRFGDAPDAVNRLLLVVYHSCLNEGIATAFLQENLRLAIAPEARDAIRELLRDDVEHARVGWAHLSSPRVDDAARAHVAAALPVLLRLAWQAWVESNAESALDCPEHGCLGPARVEDIVRDALEHLVLPGFDHVGVDTARGRGFVAQQLGRP